MFQNVKKEHRDTEFIKSSIKSGFSSSLVIDEMAFWAAVKLLISASNVPSMQVGFLLFILF